MKKVVNAFANKFFKAPYAKKMVAPMIAPKVGLSTVTNQFLRLMEDGNPFLARKVREAKETIEKVNAGEERLDPKSRAKINATLYHLTRTESGGDPLANTIIQELNEAEERSSSLNCPS